MAIEPSQHAPGRSEIHHPFTARHSTLVILTQATIAIEPSQAAFDNPALGQDHKAALLFGATHNIEHKGEEVLHPLYQLTGITLIGPHAFEAWQGAIRGIEQL